jgi:hypothetical protein
VQKPQLFVLLFVLASQGIRHDNHLGKNREIGSINGKNIVDYQTVDAQKETQNTQNERSKAYQKINRRRIFLPSQIQGSHIHKKVGQRIQIARKMPQMAQVRLRVIHGGIQKNEENCGLQQLGSLGTQTQKTVGKTTKSNQHQQNTDIKMILVDNGN